MTMWKGSGATPMDLPSKSLKHDCESYVMTCYVPDIRAGQLDINFVLLLRINTWCQAALRSR